MAPQIKKPMRVLVADEDQSIRQLVCTIVRRERLEVDCVADGREAIECLSHQEYSVILLDLMMPHLDGFGVIDYLRTHPQSFKPVVLVMTAYAGQKFKPIDPETVSGVLRKPFEMSELSHLVRLFVTGMDDEMDRLLGSPESNVRPMFAGIGFRDATRNGNGPGSGAM